MKTYIQKTKSFIKKHKIISGVAALVVLFILYKIFTGGNTQHETFVVKTGEVTQKVIVNGKTKPVDSVDLAFEVNGTVRSASVKIGSRVVVGQALVSLDSSLVYADLLKAQANVDSEQAHLDELKKGAKPEDVAVSEVEVKNAQTTLADAQQNIKDKIVDSINNKIDQLFSNPRTSNPQLNLSSNDFQLKNDVETTRVQIETILKNLNITLSDSDIQKVTTFVENVAKVVNSQTSSAGLSQTTIDGYKADLSSARASITTARETLNSAKSGLSLAQQNLSLKKSGSTPEAINSQTAKVSQMQAQVEGVQAQLSKMTLRSPQNGVVTVQDAKVGEIVTPGKALVSVISDSNLEIEASVSEVSIGKVAVGNPVFLSFDAFPGKTFNGVVAYIEPAETIVDGVVNYKVTVAFSEKYPEIKSGLTSKLDIITQIKKEVLIIPQYALTVNESGTFVMKKNGKEFVQVPVTVGLRGQDGNAEVISGLSAGDVVDVVAPK